MCIEHDVPVAEMASQLGVSRQTVYNWFTGSFEPNSELAVYIEALLSEYE
jgi:DNA-binding XRE family transcriptional regulator